MNKEQGASVACAFSQCSTLKDDEGQEHHLEALWEIVNSEGQDSL